MKRKKKKRKGSKERREVKRRRARSIDRLDVSSRADQQIGGLQIVLVNRPVQRGRAIGLRPVDVGFLLNERSDRGFVAFHDGIGNIAPAGGKRGGGDQENQR